MFKLFGGEYTRKMKEYGIFSINKVWRLSEAITLWR
jgi:hypothetical protein